MASIRDAMPVTVRKNLGELKEALDQSMPAKVLDRNLIIGSWNIRGFGDLTDKWESKKGDSPKRDLESLLCISEIVSRFDVIAIQEVKANIKCLREMVKYLGDHWNFLLTDVTRGDAGNGERMAYLFDTRKVNLSGLACELVVPKEQLAAIGADALQEQFARTPYAVSFRSGGKTFILVTLHVLYGDRAADRVPELKAIGQWLADWASDTHSYGQNLITLGDFNIDRKGDACWEAFTASGLSTPEDMNSIPRSIFDKPGESDTNKFYDQIAWFNQTTRSSKNKTVPKLTMDYVRGGHFDFTSVALKKRKLSNRSLSWHISDHYPIWAEFAL